MKKLKILLISDYFPPYIVGGAEISAYYLGIGLSKIGHDVSILTRYPKKISIKLEGFSAVHSVTYNKKKSLLSNYLHTGILSSVDMAKKLEELLKTEDFDIIHAQNWISGYAVMRVKQRMKKFPPSLLSIRDYRYLCPGLYGWCLSDKIKTNCNLINTIECIYHHSKAPFLTRTIGLIPYSILRYVSSNMLSRSVNAFDGYITNSNFLRGVILNNLAIKTENVNTVYNAINLEDFEIVADTEERSGDRIKILYVGRFDIGKGIEYLIEAIPYIIRNYNNCIFILVGDGPIKSQMENLSRKLNVSEYIIFKGFVPHRDINRYYQQCDIVVVPSSWPEPFGRTLIEAMACAKPVISTRVGGITEVISHGENGLLVKPADPEDLANALKTLIDDEEMRIQMGKCGRKSVKEKYDLDIIAKNTIKIYERVLKG